MLGENFFLIHHLKNLGGGGYLTIVHKIKNSLYKYFPETENCKWGGGGGCLMFG